MTTRVDDPTFAALPRALQRRIDNAFKRAIGKTSPRNRRKLNNDGFYAQTAPGGFVPDDSMGGFIPEATGDGFLLDEQEGGGGFIISDSDDGAGFIPEPSPPRAGPSTSTIPADRESEADGEEGPLHSDSHIPISLIPIALQILDLPPDDEQVLLVFKNAASGWTSGTASTRGSSRTAEPTEDVVSLRDWRAVCSVLLEPDVQDDEFDEEDEGIDRDMDLRMSDGVAENSAGSSEEYVESGPEGDPDEQYPDDGDDDYSDTPARRPTRSTRRRSTRANKGIGESDGSDVEIKNKPLTARQKDVSRQAFAMFLSSSADGDSEKQRITISDLVRVSKELNEKITYDQMVEMMSLISTSQDKMSVSLADFGRMMVDAKLA
ncbi:hypothetical protein BJ322DRAFT_1106673 [Thelephora terrestris]|uniref:Uncharacterized protein n=1 Tax=Thelephora terrestris TaxID=56493 RepID=A0A9P6L9P5_9AGAM|nr:hypothetical protein BJ322DRAFT_1106673 [Thelephora terrestris]